MSGWSAAVKPSGVSPAASMASAKQEGGGDPDREPDRQRQQRAPGDVATALDERDAEPGDRPELGPDDHRADDQDRRVEEDPDRAIRHASDHEGEEDAESSMFSEVRASTSSQTTASPGRPSAAFSAASATSEIAESMSSIAIEPSRVDVELAQVGDDHARVLAGDVAEDHVALGLARRALEVDHVARPTASSRAAPATCSAGAAGTTIRMWTIAAQATLGARAHRLSPAPAARRARRARRRVLHRGERRPLPRGGRRGGDRGARRRPSTSTASPRRSRSGITRSGARTPATTSTPTASSCARRR